MKKPRPGAPRTITDEQVELVMTKTLESRVQGRTTGRPGQGRGDRNESAGDLAGSADLRPQAALLRDVEAIGGPAVHRDKRSDVVGLYLNPPDKAPVRPLMKELHLVCDNYPTHKTPEVKRWLLRHLRIHLHFTPTSGRSAPAH